MRYMLMMHAPRGTGDWGVMQWSPADLKAHITFMQDFASSNVDATLRPLLGSNTGATVIIYKSGTTATSTSPKWTMVGLLAKYQPLNADVGKPSMVDVEFLNGSATGITFGTS